MRPFSGRCDYWRVVSRKGIYSVQSQSISGDATHRTTACWLAEPYLPGAHADALLDLLAHAGERNEHDQRRLSRQVEASDIARVCHRARNYTACADPQNSQ